MKKYWFILPMFLVCLFCVGCGDSNNVFSLISEQSEVYFYGEKNGTKASIAIGKREDPYILDGVHNKVVDFSLITVDVGGNLHAENLSISLVVAGQEQNIMLELNPLNMTYMADVGYALSRDDVMAISVLGEVVQLENISQKFNVDCNEAIEIGLENIENPSMFMQNGKFNCEGYIKLLDGSRFGGVGLYWHFTLLNNQGESATVLINTMDKNDVFSG